VEKGQGGAASAFASLIVENPENELFLKENNGFKLVVDSLLSLPTDQYILMALRTLVQNINIADSLGSDIAKFIFKLYPTITDSDRKEKSLQVLKNISVSNYAKRILFNLGIVKLSIDILDSDFEAGYDEALDILWNFLSADEYVDKMLFILKIFNIEKILSKIISSWKNFQLVEMSYSILHRFEQKKVT